MPAYHPSPIDTSTVGLSPEIKLLTEKLAENAHDIWAAERMSKGWTWGEERNDGNKWHPCLVPYSRLPEHEKDYDRQMVLGTLKAILALGYTIHPPAAEGD